METVLICLAVGYVYPIQRCRSYGYALTQLAQTFFPEGSTASAARPFAPPII
jgi:hypothetical protein